MSTLLLISVLFPELGRAATCRLLTNQRSKSETMVTSIAKNLLFSYPVRFDHPNFTVVGLLSDSTEHPSPKKYQTYVLNSDNGDIFVFQIKHHQKTLGGEKFYTFTFIDAYALLENQNLSTLKDKLKALGSYFELERVAYSEDHLRETFAYRLTLNDFEDDLEASFKFKEALRIFFASFLA